MNNQSNITKLITTAQIKKIHVMLGKAGLMSRKAEIMCDISNGRTTHCGDLTCDEAILLIQVLENTLEQDDLSQFETNTQPQTTKKNTPSERDELIKQIYRKAFEWGIIYGKTDEDIIINLYLIDKFCTERGTVKKKLAQMTYMELKKTLQQFQAILKAKKSK